MEITGHSGAGSLAPPNTLAGFQAAIDAGVDRIEFDVSRRGRFFRDRGSARGHDRLFLAHHPRDIDTATLAFEEGLEFLAASGVPLACDLKTIGGEPAIADGLVRHGVADRTIICGHDVEALHAVRDLAPGVQVGWSLPQARGTRGIVVPGPPEHASANGWRLRLPPVAEQAIRAGDCDGLMVHYLLLSPELADAVHAAGGFLHVWTVDDPKVAEWVARCGADAITSNDPARIRARLTA